MKIIRKILLISAVVSLASCGGKKEKEKEKISLDEYSSTPAPEKEKEASESTKEVKASERVDLENKGVGPVKNVELAPEIDQEMAARGEQIYKNKCTACHKPDKRFVGPAQKGVLDRRSPEWVMNMILNPEVMIQKDPLAKDLLMEFNGSPMANQSLTREEARAVLEYFRTL